MKAVSPGDAIKDNVGRRGVAVIWTRRPARDWLKIQTDARMRKARGRWLHVCVFDSGAVLRERVDGVRSGGMRVPTRRRAKR